MFRYANSLPLPLLRGSVTDADQTNSFLVRKYAHEYRGCNFCTTRVMRRPTSGAGVASCQDNSMNLTGNQRDAKLAQLRCCDS